MLDAVLLPSCCVTTCRPHPLDITHDHLHVIPLWSPPSLTRVHAIPMSSLCDLYQVSREFMPSPCHPCVISTKSHESSCHLHVYPTVISTKSHKSSCHLHVIPLWYPRSLTRVHAIPMLSHCDLHQISREFMPSPLRPRVVSLEYFYLKSRWSDFLNTLDCHFYHPHT